MTSDWSYPGRYNLSTGKLEKKRECGAAVGWRRILLLLLLLLLLLMSQLVVAGRGWMASYWNIMMYEPSLNTVLAK